MRWPTPIVAAVVGSSLAACGDQSGTLPEGQPLDDLAGYSGVPIMDPGDDCMQCHSASGDASARAWTVAGTIFQSESSLVDAGIPGVQILLTDVNGQQLTLTSNAAGNFYTDQPLAALTDVEVQRGSARWVMQLGVVSDGPASPALIGSCNRCHTLAASPGLTLGVDGAPGRLFVR